MNDVTRPPRPVKPAPQQPVSAPLTPVSKLQSPRPDPLTLGPKKSRKKWWILGAVGGLLLIAIIMGIIGFFWYKQALDPRSDAVSKIRVDVAPGASTGEVADALETKGVIRSSLAAQIYMRVHNQGNIKAGSYLFSPNQTTAEVVGWLNDGRVDTFKVTILPGRTLADIKQELVNQGFGATDVDAAFAKQYNHPLLKDKPANVNLEGYIFPETYFMTASSTPEDVLIRTFDEFQKRIDTDGTLAKLSAHGLDLHQGITLASIVSGEAPGSADRRQIAQVFESRLAAGMNLGSDITYIYAAKLLGVTPSANIDSPYNTRIHGGFPPGAVSNFNFDALEAVANPATGNYLFFVAGDDGVVHYAYTEQQHQANINNFCKKACFSN